MNAFRTILGKWVAVALLAWIGLGAVAAPITACCGETEANCCAVHGAGQGCAACATAPALPSAPPPKPQAGQMEKAQPAAPSPTPALPTPPWSPPD